MENVSKALIIAGSILIAILILTLIVVFWNQMSSYSAAKHDEKMIEQTVEFNNKFENYNGQTIRGNELISLLNRVIDYNNYSAQMEGFERIIISVDLKGHEDEMKYLDENTDNRLGTNIFTLTGTRIVNTTNDASIRKITELSSELTKNSGIPNITDTKLQKLSAEISTVLDDREENKAKRSKKLKNILGYEVTNETDLNKIKKATIQYYQYTQFKRAMFKVTKVDHNVQQGRVNDITVEIVEENGKVKFD